MQYTTEWQRVTLHDFLSLMHAGRHKSTCIHKHARTHARMRPALSKLTCLINAQLRVSLVTMRVRLGLDGASKNTKDSNHGQNSSTTPENTPHKLINNTREHTTQTHQQHQRTHHTNSSTTQENTPHKLINNTREHTTQTHQQHQRTHHTNSSTAPENTPHKLINNTREHTTQTHQQHQRTHHTNSSTAPENTPHKLINKTREHTTQTHQQHQRIHHTNSLTTPENRPHIQYHTKDFG